MKNFLILLAFLLAAQFAVAQNCLTPTATYTDTWNNITPTFYHGGGVELTGYKNAESISLTTVVKGIWLGTMYEGDLRVAISDYSISPAVNESDFWPGPVNPPTSNEYDAETCADFDRFFRVNYNEVTAHQLDYFVDGVINESPHPHILGWPGRGNPNFLDIHGWELPDTDLAPFFDYDNDGNYEPLDGDYPLIKGSWNLWRIINDAGNIHTASDGDNMRAEIKILLYGQLSSETLADTYFSEIEVKNGGSSVWEDFHFGMWRSNLGGELSRQGGIGCVPDEKYSYLFVAEDDMPDNDIYVPFFEITQIMPAQTEMQTDNFSYFTYFINPAQGNPPPTMTDPTTVLEYHNYLTGKWRDGTPLTYGGNGYGGETQTNYAYSGDWAGTEDWIFCNDPFTDEKIYRTVMSSSFGDMLPGQKKTITYAHTVKQTDNVGCDFDLTDIVNNIENEWQNGPVISNTDHPSPNKNITVFPNPFGSELTITSETQSLESVEIYDTAGKSVFTKKPETHQTTINPDLPKGLYFLKIETKEGAALTTKITKMQ